MKALEFQTTLTPEQTLAVPPEVASQVPAGQAVRVLLLVEDAAAEEAEDEAAWKRLAAEQFFAYEDEEMDRLYNPKP